MEVHGVSEKNLLKLVMKKRCAHTDKNLKLLIRIHMPSAGHNVEIVSSSRKDAKSGGELARAFCQSEGGPGNAAICILIYNDLNSHEHDAPRLRLESYSSLSRAGAAPTQ